MRTVIRALVRSKLAVLAVVATLTLVTASAAVAGSGVGATFNLGKTNTVNAMSTLVGTALQSMLKIDNNGTGTALDLQVGSSTTAPADKTVPPMKVDSQALVANLNADELDGKDSEQFFPKATYAKSTTSTGTNLGNGRFLLAAYCDPGDKIISGGHYEMDAGTTLFGSVPDHFHQGWQVEWINDGTADSLSVTAYCADFGTPHTP